MRTCVGCRARAGRSRLLRVVAVGTQLVPDLRNRLPGRGAWVHPDPGCLELARRRRAFVRALRLQGPVDDTAVGTVVEQISSAGTTSTNGTTSITANTVEIGSGSASDGHPMSSQR